MPPAKAPHLPLHTTLLVGALDARPRERRLVQVVRAKRHQPLLLHPPATPQDLLHRRAQVVVADQGEAPAEKVERLDVAFQERLLGLALKRHREAHR